MKTFSIDDGDTTSVEIEVEDLSEDDYVYVVNQISNGRRTSHSNKIEVSGKSDSEESDVETEREEESFFKRYQVPMLAGGALFIATLGFVGYVIYRGLRADKRNKKGKI